MLPVHSPRDGSLICELRPDDARDVERKYLQARAALPGWWKTPFGERAAAVRRFWELLSSRMDDCARILSLEMGKPIAQAKREIQGVKARVDFFLEKTPELLRPETVHAEEKLTETIAYGPLGVVGNISAWNYPYFVGANVFLPALLTGNTVLYKPSEFASLTGIRIGELLHEAGVPVGVFQVLVGGGETGGALLGQPLDGIFFTGSYATGVKVAREAAVRLMRIQLELGGKDPTYVAEDVDVVAAAKSLADGAFYNTGQSCCAVERIYVHERVHDRFVEEFLKEVETFVVGDPLDENTYIGPLARPAQLAVLERQVRDAVTKGARCRLGGKRMDGPGAFFEPTVLTEVTHAMEVMREESFGPIIGIQRVSGDGEAVEKMNDTPYGLTAGVYCREESRAREILDRVSAGSLYWNCCDRVSPRLPWSGYGHSGVGVTLSRHGIAAFLRPRALHFNRP